MKQVAGRITLDSESDFGGRAWDGTYPQGLLLGLGIPAPTTEKRSEAERLNWGGKRTGRFWVIPRGKLPLIGPEGYSPSLACACRSCSW